MTLIADMCAEKFLLESIGGTCVDGKREPPSLRAKFPKKLHEHIFRRNMIGFILGHFD